MISPAVHIVEFLPEHLDIFELDIPSGDPGAIKASLAEMAQKGDWYSGFVPQGLAGIGGITPMWPGVANAWFGPTPLARRYPLALCEVARRAMDQARANNHLHRIECQVWAAHPTSHHWVRFLGFAREGLLRKYGPNGEDYVMYARVF